MTGAVIPTDNKTILNLTQHIATPQQVNQGVIEPTPEHKLRIQNLLTFEDLPDTTVLEERAKELTDLVQNRYPGIEAVMIGGASYFTPYLAKTLTDNNIQPLYSFTKRFTVEAASAGDANQVEKKSTFRHEGFAVDPYWIMLNGRKMNV